MRKVRLSMKEDLKYSTIRELVDHGGNKLRAACSLGITIRHVNRLIKIYKDKGKDGFVHHNKNRQPVNSFPPELSASIVNLYSSKYKGFNFRHFCDLLDSEENIHVSYSSVYRILSTAGFLSLKAHRITRKNALKKKMKADKPQMNEHDIEVSVSHQLQIEDAHPRKERKKYFGEEIQMDGSIHLWFGDRKACLHLAVDNCTGIPVGAYFDWQETLNGYYHVFYQILKNYGIPFAFKTDNRTVFNYNSEKNKKDDHDVLTQFGYACRQLGTSITTTSVSQAKGQIERANGTFQGRLVNELKLHGITTIEQANDYLSNSFIPDYIKRFALDSSKFQSVFEQSPSDDKINCTLAVLSPRKFDSGSAIKYLNHYYQAYNENGDLCCFVPKTECLIICAYDGSLYVTVDDSIYALREVKEHLEHSDNFDSDLPSNSKKKAHIPPMSHPWKRASFLAQQQRSHELHRFA